MEDPADLNNDVTEGGVFQTVLDGYDAMYDALPNSKTFTDIWRTNAYGGDFPEEFAHIGFLTLGEGRRLLELCNSTSARPWWTLPAVTAARDCGWRRRPARP